METEYETRGFYKPSFFSIFINGGFDMNFENMIQKDLGTFVHEYIHYLQNITTIFGLRNSIFYFSYLFEVKKYLYENSNIKLPLKDIPFSEHILKGQAVFKKYHGEINNPNPYYDKTTISLKNVDKQDKSDKIVNINLYVNEVKTEEVVIGNLSIKEGMARLYQLIYDPDVEHPTFPYKSVEILCETLNPELLEDKRKLIALCILALNSQNSAYTLYQLLIEVRAHNELEGRDIYAKYMNERWIVNSGKKISIQKFLIDSIKKFKEKLNGSIFSELNHFNKIFQNMEDAIELGINPLIEVLYEIDATPVERLKSLVDFYGIPHIRTINGFVYYPKGEKDAPAMEYVELLGQRVVLERVFGFQGEICSQLSQCALAETEMIDENCYSTQWKRETPCEFKVVSDFWELNKKTIS